MNKIFKRGDIFYADLGTVIGMEQEAKRPVIIIQNNIGNKYSPTVVVACILSGVSKGKSPTHVEISAKEVGIHSDSLILLEQIRSIDKRRLREKIATAPLHIIRKVDKALSVELDITESLHLSDLQKQSYISSINKPLVLTEGKTDVKIIDTAWRKLYPEKEPFFECDSSGIQYDIEKRVGSADSVRRSIQYWSTNTQRSIIGLFDNDREGNEQFKSLDGEIFEKYDISKDTRKHRDTNVWGVLLPVPEFRKLFVTDDDITQRYFAIEHYFSDEVLKRFGMYGKNILGTSVFKLNNRKGEFANEIKELGSLEFENFRTLFNLLERLLINK
ncbi:hypothetical protein CP373A1_02860 [Clostridium paraputrificum]|uniref:PemK-like protein n=1 Tax=Clostridium paraputrificum TaxID=29363 RepID=A0A1B8RSS2_9CLOT|nr:hypothetical protein CP373A1_02860 [Clostridium paraputrificum]